MTDAAKAALFIAGITAAGTVGLWALFALAAKAFDRVTDELERRVEGEDLESHLSEGIEDARAGRVVSRGSFAKYGDGE
jgi:hypothetical protein